MTKTPIIQSKKQKIRLWFEFLKLCHLDPDLTTNLVRSKSKYREWGDILDVKFDEWWKDHRGLFGNERVEEIERIVKQSNVLNVAIPLNQTVTRSLNEIKHLIEERQRSRLTEVGIDPNSVKSMSVGFGKFELTEGVEIRGRTLYEVLLIYGIWLEMGKPSVNSDFCMEVIDRLKKRPRSRWAPHILSVEPTTDLNGNLRIADDVIRKVRRHIDRGKRVSQSVSLGEFPGR